MRHAVKANGDCADWCRVCYEESKHRRRTSKTKVLTNTARSFRMGLLNNLRGIENDKQRSEALINAYWAVTIRIACVGGLLFCTFWVAASKSAAVKTAEITADAMYWKGRTISCDEAMGAPR